MNLSKQIIARNKAYDAASPARKRVMLAEEVLRLIEIRTADPIYGTYMARDAAGISTMESAQPHIAMGNIRCKVCAKGAMFLAGVSFKNQLTIGELSMGFMGDVVSCNRTAHDKDDKLELVALFGEETLDQIESDFENGYYKGELQTADTQLARIMKNIIANRGRYKGIPTDAP